MRMGFSRIAAARPKTAILSAALLLIATPLALPFGFAGADASISGPLDAVARILALRSPGERAEARLRQSKAAKKVPPTEKTVTEVPDEDRILGKIFPPRTSENLVETPEELIASLGPPPVQFPTDGLLVPAQTPAPPVPVAGFFVPDFIGGGGGAGGGGSNGGGGGGGGSGGSPPDGTPVTPPVAAVPEPETWALLIFGFALCGAAMRRRRTVPCVGCAA